MKRVVLGFLILLTAQQAGAASDYGPAKRWKGIGYKFGYEDDYAKDGAWRIKARTRHGHGEDMAVYRAAERAREAGYEYVQFLRGWGSEGPGFSYAEVEVLPSHSPAAPTACRSTKPGACYTADVAEVLRRLAGDSGTEPGVAATDHLDDRGRRVTYGGYGIGAITTGGLRATSAMAARPAPPQTIRLTTEPSAAERQAAAIRAAQPVRGREPKLGWTISD